MKISSRAEDSSRRLEGAWEDDILQMGSRQDTTSAVPVYPQKKERRASTTAGMASNTEGRASRSIMKVTHTPLLVQKSKLYTGQNELKVPGAGIENACGYKDRAKTVQATPDMRKAVNLQRSPVQEINLSRSPILVHGRLEMFGDMNEMVDYWNAKEEEEDGKVTREGGGKRRSRRIEELCGLFEGGEESEQSRLPRSTDSGGGEGRVSTKYQQNFRTSTGGSNIQTFTNISQNSFVCEDMVESNSIQLTSSECESDVKQI